MVRLKVKEIAESKGISMSKLSRIADVSYNTIRAIYRNPQHDVTMETLNRIARALGCTVNDLIEDVPDD